MKRYFYSLTVVVMYLVTSYNLYAQDKAPVKFGKISKDDFDLSRYRTDSSADAVVVSDIGTSSFEGNRKGWFSLIFKHQKRIVVLKKDGLDAANVTIPL